MTLRSSVRTLWRRIVREHRDEPRELGESVDEWIYVAGRGNGKTRGTRVSTADFTREGRSVDWPRSWGDVNQERVRDS